MQDGEFNSTDLAERRTDWAEDRTVLANERTFAGWMRTGLAAVAIAVGLKAIFGAADAPFAPARLAATLFLAVSVGIFFTAWRKAKGTLDRLDQHTAEPVARGNMGLIALALSAGSVATGVLLWLV